MIRNLRLSVSHPRWLALLALLAVPAYASDETAEWRFEVLLNDKPIGFHRFELTTSDSNQVLESEASFDVKVLFFNAFSYRHETTETWRDGCLTSLTAQTNSNGKRLSVVGERQAEGFSVTHNGGGETLTDCVRSFAYWNPSILSAERLLNAQTGEYEPVSVIARSDDRVTVGDTVIAADRYTLSAKGGDVTLWYARSDARWLALEAPAKGGRRLRYEPVSVPPADELPQQLASRD